MSCRNTVTTIDSKLTEKKRQYGYPSTPLVATGQLYESVRAEVIYE